MRFEEALAFARDNKKIRISSWSKGSFLNLLEKEFYFYCDSVQGIICSLLTPDEKKTIHIDEILSEDWELFDYDEYYKELDSNEV